jgi:hypothetical protein
MEQLDAAGPEARQRFFAKRTPEEREQLAAAIPAWRASKSAPAPEPAKPSAASVGVHHGLQGMTLGFADELGGAAGAAAQGVVNLLPQSLRDSLDLVSAPVADAYADIRDTERQTLKEGKAAHGGVAMGAELIGGVLSPVNAIGAGVQGLRGAVGLGAGMGAAYGLGSSDADSAGELVRDTTIGGVFGAGGGALAHGVGVAADRAGKWAGGKVAAATQKIDDLATKRAAEPTATARSGAGTSATDAYRKAELTLQNPQATAQEVREAAMLLMERNTKATAGLGDAATRKAAKSAEYVQAMADEPARKAAAVKEIGDPWVSVKQLAKTYAVPLVGAAVGGVAGDGPLGAIAGGGIGMLTGRGYSPMVNNVIRHLKKPAMQRALWTPVSLLAQKNPQALGRFGKAIAGALGTGGDDAGLALHYALLNSDPEYGQRVAELAESAE